MNCPNCGNTNVVGDPSIIQSGKGIVICNDCGEVSQYQKPKPTPQEMLWWLAENTHVEICKSSGNICLSINKARKYNRLFARTTLTEAVTAAYMAAKEVQNDTKEETNKQIC